MENDTTRERETKRRTLEAPRECFVESNLLCVLEQFVGIVLTSITTTTVVRAKWRESLVASRDLILRLWFVCGFIPLVGACGNKKTPRCLVRFRYDTSTNDTFHECNL
jgi:hypothetical protein